MAQHSDLDKIRQLLFTGERSNIEMAMVLAETNKIDLSPIDIGVKTILTYGKCQPRLRWQGAELGNIIYTLRVILTFSMGDIPIAVIPPEIGLFRSVGIIEICDNFVEIIPPEIEHLRNLRSLNLRNNRIREIPNSIGNIAGLKTLLLQSNKIEQLPESIGNLQRLEVLDISQNPALKSLPKSIKSLPNLKRIIVDSSQSEWVSQQISSHTAIEYSKNT